MTADLKQDGSEIPRLLATLKKLFRSKGILYKEVAESLKVSETTVKRWLTGHPITLDIVENLCRIAGIRLTDLVEISREEIEASRLTYEQEVDLASDPFLACLFYLISRGCKPPTLQRDFDIDDAEMNRYLTKLDRLGLIQLFPYNRIKLRVSRDFTVEQGGPMMRNMRATLVQDLFEGFDITNNNWTFSFSKLSSASVRRVRQLLDEFMATLAAITEGDRDLPTDLAEWFAFLFMMQPVDIGGFKTGKVSPPAPTRAEGTSNLHRPVK